MIFAILAIVCFVLAILAGLQAAWVPTVVFAVLGLVILGARGGSLL